MLGILSTAIWSNNDAVLAYGQEQAAPTTTTATPTIKITSPTKGQQVSPGELTITGISSDDVTSDCTVYTDWNDLKPMQKVTPRGGEGTDDYSSWTFTYAEDYHLITEGLNELTSKISCENSPSNITKSYSINVTGVATGQGQQQQGQQQEQKPTLEEEEIEGKTTGTESETPNNGNNPLTLPFSSNSSDIEEGSSESQEEQGGEVTTNKQDNDENVTPNDDNEPTIHWDLD